MTTLNKDEIGVRPVTVVAHTPDGAARRTAEPVTFGVPFARGVVKGEQTWSLRQSGRLTPVQTQVLDCWPDGSVRWLLVDARVDGPAASCELVQQTADAPAVTPVSVRSQGRALTVTTGAITAVIDPDAAFPLTSITGRDGSPLTVAGGATLRISGANGAPWGVTWQPAVVEVAGPLRSLISLAGRATTGDGTLDLEVSLTFYAASAVIGIRLRVRNPAAAAHPGGKWDLGDPKSVQLKEMSISLPIPSIREARLRPEPGTSWVAGEPDVALFQASSGGERWNSSNHVNRQQRVALDFRGYEAASSRERLEGNRASPLLEWNTVSGRGGVRCRYFWQAFPKAMEVRGGAVIVSQFPAQSADAHELQPGEQSTWDFAVAFASDAVGTDTLEWIAAPTFLRPDPVYCAASGAIPHLTPEAIDQHADYLALVKQAIDGPSAFHEKREVIDEYGWRHFGDVYGDHEAVFHKGETPLVSHWNNQYDAVFGGLVQLLRSGDARWLPLALELAAHIVDIDIYHTTQDKTAYNGGLFWHTCHYVDADTASHRTYPSRQKVNGGGPSCGHLYTTGLLHAYFLTGDRRYRDAVAGLADYVINCDDGRQTMFRWLDSGPTGHATVSGLIPYHGPGRAPANALNALVDGHRLTGDDRYLSKAFEIVSRCVHPNDDVPAQNLLDAENKWFYTMFLQSLGKLLEHLQERGTLDTQYFYARETLLAYARWMAANERPFLDEPEKLEYPTETWAAQDMRKSEVFQWAAKHASGPEREEFFRRATFFFDYSVRALSGFPSRNLCRPVVLMMVNGWTRSWFTANLNALPAPAAKPAAVAFGKPTRFVPQKERAIAKAKRIVVIGGGLAVAAMLGGLWLLLS